MRELDKHLKVGKQKEITHKEEQRGCLSSSSTDSRCSSLCYTYTENDERLDAAYDILFKEVFKICKQKPWKE